jgi:hypothetical protein
MVEFSSQSSVLLSRYCTKHKYLLAFGELDMKLLVEDFECEMNFPSFVTLRS